VHFHNEYLMRLVCINEAKYSLVSCLKGINHGTKSVDVSMRMNTTCRTNFYTQECFELIIVFFLMQIIVQRINIYLKKLSHIKDNYEVLSG
jgi:hypothetical protein